MPYMLELGGIEVRGCRQKARTARILAERLVKKRVCTASFSAPEKDGEHRLLRLDSTFSLRQMSTRGSIVGTPMARYDSIILSLNIFQSDSTTLEYSLCFCQP